MLPKYIFVSGGVLSGLGKGVVSASIGFLLQSRGYKVTPVKCENYINIDSGLINPIEHGDPFLCEDGTEADMDMGTYEKFLNKNVGKHNFITMGQIYQEVIRKERNFEYQGEDVEAIPHVSDEIIRRIKEAGEIERADIVVVELGGTAGEYQNALYYEASRIMKSVHHDTVTHVHVSYVPTPFHLGEPKTKPTQLSVHYLNSMGIQPDFIVCRSEKAIDERRRQRLAMFCSVDTESVINNPDEKIIYNVPLTFAKQNFDQKILKLMGLSAKKLNIQNWENFVQKTKTAKKEVKIVIVGKYFATGDYQLRDSYAALFDALDHAGWFLGAKVRSEWINAENINEQSLNGLKGLIVPIGWGERGVEGMIRAIKYAREQKIPYLGLCYGMQLAAVEFARNVAKLEDASSTEVNPKTKYPIIHTIPSQKEIIKRRAYGGTMRLGSWDCRIKEDTISFSAYQEFNWLKSTPRAKSRGLKEKVVSERHRHRYEFNNAYSKALSDCGLVISGRSVIENLAEIIELPRNIHPFFVGTQFHPEYKSRPLSPHPLFVAFLRSSLYN
ncbi:CTP synthase [Candidatus Gottesmanbacteria bacterium]|nr:CTP synthase [Candidatus Gottesmanbacteria bacterium]